MSIKKSLDLHARGSEVAALQKQLVNSGHRIPDWELNASVYGEGTREAIKDIQRIQGLPETGIYDNITRQKSSRYLKDRIPLSFYETAGGRVNGQTLRDPEESGIVQGRLYFPSGEAAAGIPIKIYNKVFGQTTNFLAEGETAEDGSFELAYELSAGVHNIELRALDVKGLEVRISRVHRNAPTSLTIEAVVPASVQQPDPEYDRLMKSLHGQALTVEKLAKLKEDQNTDDISLLHTATGWDARLIAIAVIAARKSLKYGVRHDFCYALFRVGIAYDDYLWAGAGINVVKKALQKAIDSQIVNLTDAEITEALDGYKLFAEVAKLKQLSDRRAPGTLSTFKEMVDASGLDTAKRIQFMINYFSFIYSNSEEKDLWTIILEDENNILDETDIATLKLQGKLGQLTRNNARLSQELLGSTLQVTDPLHKLVDEEYDKAATWKSHIETLAGGNDAEIDKLIPPTFKGETTSDRLDAYAKDLAWLVTQNFPERTVFKRLDVENGTINLGDSLINSKVRGFLGTVTDDPESNFSIRCGQKDFTVFEEVDEEDRSLVMDHIFRMQRLYRISPSQEAFEALLNSSFGSAREISAMSRQDFESALSTAFSNVEELGLIHTAAREVDMATQMIGAVHLQGESYSQQAVPYVLRSMPLDEENLPPTFNGINLHLQELLGGIDYCRCEHCRSVLSPAAYLVDLFELLRASDSSEDNPFDLLNNRRPDLANIKLSCENTHTSLPYIDLVNEILEALVADGALDGDEIADTESSLSEDLVAEPSYRNIEAYETLADAHSRPELPFDLATQMLRSFGEQFDTPLTNLQAIFRTNSELWPDENSDYGHAAVFLESLGLTPPQVELFTTFINGTAPDDWVELYGYEVSDGVATVLSELKNAKALSHKLQISYEDLDRVLKTKFVNSTHPCLEALREINRNPNYTVGGLNYEVTLEEARLHADNLVTQPSGSWTTEDTDFDGILDALEAASGDAFNKSDWLDDFRSMLVLSPLDCKFEDTELVTAGFADPVAFDFIKLNLFVRLHKTLGWSFEELDLALVTFIPAGSHPLSVEDLGEALHTALIYISHLEDLNSRLRLGRDSRVKLAALWSNLSQPGHTRLYRQLFGFEGVSSSDSLFFHPLGEFLIDTESTLLADVLPELQAAMGMTAEQIHAVLHDIFPGDITSVTLTMENVTSIYRYKLLADGLRMSVNELMTLKQLSGLSPFEPLSSEPLATIDDDNPYIATMAFVELAEQIKDSPLSIEDLDFLTRHQFDPVGVYREDPNYPLAQLLALRKALDPQDTKFRIPQDDLDLTDHYFAEQLGYLLAPDALKTFLANWAATARYTAEVDLTGVYASSETVPGGSSYVRLTDADFENETDILVGWIEPDQQTLIYRGPRNDDGDMPEERKSELLALVSDGPDKVAQENLLSTLIDNLIYLEIPAASFASETELTVYPAEGSTQRIAYLGLLSDAKKAALLDTYTADSQHDRRALLEKFLDRIQAQGQSLLHLDPEGKFPALVTTHDLGEDSPLDPEDFEAEPNLEVFENKSIQYVIYHGVMTKTKHDALVAQFSSPSWLVDKFGSMRGDQIAQCDFLKDRILQDDNPLQVSNLFDDLFAAVYSEPTAVAYSDEPSRRRALLTPWLEEAYTHEASETVVQYFDKEYDVDQDLLAAVQETLKLVLDPENPVDDPANRRSLISVFSAHRGVRAAYTSDYPEGDTEKIQTRLSTHDCPSHTSKARFEGVIRVPQKGKYHFHIGIGGDDGGETEYSLALSMLGEEAVLAEQGFTDELDLWVSLTADTLYYLDFRVELPYGSTDDGIAHVELLYDSNLSAVKRPVADILVYDPDTLGLFVTALTTLKKAIQVLDVFELTAEEFLHFQTHSPDFAGFDLALLPTEPTFDPPTPTTVLLSWLRDLNFYRSLKRDLAGESGDLLAAFLAAKAVPESLSWEEFAVQLAELTRRTPETVTAVANSIGINEENAQVELHNAEGLQRLWEALQVIEAIGVPADRLKEWITPALDYTETLANALRLRNALKARFTIGDWRDMATSLFNGLRQKQRDALVAYVLHITDGVDTVEQLYEYLLIDPGMEPVVLTSRIRLAISSVQLFIQRCMLGLEKTNDTSPTNVVLKGLTPETWKWMKNYRVWEANRKVFLYPENWLEPEFRDDKTHLFRELESKLLGGEVSNETAEDAFYDYLIGLSEIARLEIVTMYMEEGDNVSISDNILHVVGRTYKSPHKYFYRRFVHESWTPWEPVEAEIEGDHIVCAVWRNRFHIFWLSENFTEKRKKGEIVTVVSKIVDLHLNWVEYFEGQWSPRRKTDDRSLMRFKFPKIVSAAEAQQQIHSLKLGISIGKPDPETGLSDGPIWVTLGEPIHGYFLLEGRNDLPVASPSAQPGQDSMQSRLQYSDSPTFDSAYLAASEVPLLGMKFPYHRQFGILMVTDPDDPKAFADNPTGYYYVLKGCAGNDHRGIPAIVPCSSFLKFPNSESGRFMTPFAFQEKQITLVAFPYISQNDLAENYDYVVKYLSHDDGSGDSDGNDFEISHNVKPAVNLHLQRQHLKPVINDEVLENEPISILPPENFIDSGSFKIEMTDYFERTQSDFLLNDLTAMAFDEVLLNESGRMNVSMISGDAVEAAHTSMKMGITSQVGKNTDPDRSIELFVSMNNEYDQITTIYGPSGAYKFGLNPQK
ncbi:MAG: peptidoglycan-binding protein [Deltaproteobacteria bacterium]|nr:peptidoglycan-binding protein [Deltaproteobacteria bacterium]